MIAFWVCLLFWILTMEHSRESQQVEVRTCVDLGMRHCDIVHHLGRIHGNHALSSSTIHRWMKQIQAGRRDVTVRKSTGCPTKLTDAVIRSIRDSLDQDRTKPLGVIAQEHCIGLATAHKAVRKALKMKKHPCVWRPHELNAAQRRKHLQLSRRVSGSQSTRDAVNFGAIIARSCGSKWMELWRTKPVLSKPSSLPPA